MRGERVLAASFVIHILKGKVNECSFVSDVFSSSDTYRISPVPDRYSNTM